MSSLALAMRLSDAELVGNFEQRDVLAGTMASFRSGEKRVTGRVLRIEPMQGLAVEVDGEEIWLPAMTTTVQPA